MGDHDAASPVLLAECYAPASGTDEPAAAARRVSDACAELRMTGVEIRYLGALIVPGDELAYHVFAAADAEVVSRAASRAGLAVERIVPSVLALPIIIELDRAVGHAADEIGP